MLHQKTTIFTASILFFSLFTPMNTVQPHPYEVKSLTAQEIDEALDTFTNYVGSMVPSTVFSQETKKKIEADIYNFLKKKLPSVKILNKIRAEIQNYQQQHSTFWNQRAHLLAQKMLNNAKSFLMNIESFNINQQLSPLTEQFLHDINYEYINSNIHKYFNDAAAPYLKERVVEHVHHLIDYIPHLIDHAIIKECTIEDIAALHDLASLSIFQELTQGQHEELLGVIFQNIFPSKADVIKNMLHAKFESFKSLTRKLLS